MKSLKNNFLESLSKSIFADIDMGFIRVMNVVMAVNSIVDILQNYKFKPITVIISLTNEKKGRVCL